MRLHLETPPPALGGPSLQLPQLLPEHATQTLLHSDQMLPEQTTPQVGATLLHLTKLQITGLLLPILSSYTRTQDTQSARRLGYVDGTAVFLEQQFLSITHQAVICKGQLPRLHARLGC